MDVRGLSRADLTQAMQALRGSRVELGQRIDEDQRVFNRLKGDTFGAMCDSAERNVARERRIGNAWHGAQAVGALGGGYMGLTAISAWHNGVSAMPTVFADPMTNLVVGLALVGTSYYCQSRVTEAHAAEARAMDHCQRTHSWTFMLQEGDRLAKEQSAQTRSSVVSLVDGLKAAPSGILLEDASVRVGGVRVKRRQT